MGSPPTTPEEPLRFAPRSPRVVSRERPLRRRGRAGVDLASMQSLKAHVKNGRLLLDEPTDLPEGEVIELVRAEADSVDDEDRAALHESLEVSIEQMNNGQLIDADEALAKLRARR
jgi:hypothetical protein